MSKPTWEQLHLCKYNSHYKCGVLPELPPLIQVPAPPGERAGLLIGVLKNSPVRGELRGLRRLGLGLAL